MDTFKKIVIYSLLVVLFFIFSRILIYIAINTTYAYKQFDFKTDLKAQITVEATSVNGIVKGNIEKTEFEKIQNKYIKLDYYTKNEVHLGTKYVEVGTLEDKENFEFEMRTNYNHIDRVEIDIVDDVSDEPEEFKISDKEMEIKALLTALFLIKFVL